MIESSLTARRMLLLCLAIVLAATPSLSADDRVWLGCPIAVPSPNGDSVAVPVYFSNIDSLGGFSLGLYYNSDDIECTSTDVSSSYWVGENGLWTPTFHPDLNAVLLGWIDFSAQVSIPPTDSGLMCYLWFQVPAGTTPQCVDIDSGFVPPAGYWVFSPAGGGNVYPAYDDCGPGDINIGNMPDCYPPIVDDIPDQTVPEGGTFATFDLDDYVYDESNPDNELDWTYSGNLELSVSINSAHVATIGIPGAHWHGSETITFRATDPNGLWDEDDATFTVTSVPDPPVAGDTSVVTDEDTDLVSSLPGFDYDEDPLTWAILSGPNHGILSAFEPNTGDYTYDPADNYNGPDTLEYEVDDGTGLADTGKVYITVNSINDPPVVSDIPGETITEGGSFATINLDDYVADVDHLDSEMDWTVSGNSDLDVQIDVNRVATIVIPHPDWFGSETITFRAEDPEGGWDSDPATFTVNGTPDPPVAGDTSVSTPEDVPLSATLPGYDVDLEPVTFTILSGPNHGSLSSFDSGTGDYTYESTLNYFGPDTLSYEIDDGAFPPETGFVFITVTPVNDPPEVGDIPDQEIAEGGSFATINLDDYVTDVESAVTEMSWSYTGNVDLDVDIDINRVATIVIPSSDWYGVETITFIATDPGDESGSDPATFTVTNVNDPPVVDDIPGQSLPEGSSFATFDLDDYVVDIDDPDAQIDWDYTGNSDLSVSISGAHVVTVEAPYPDWYGAETITFTATDTSGEFDSDAATFELTAVNDPPVVGDIPDQDINTDGTFDPINLDDYVSDIDDPDENIDWTYSGNVDLIVTIDENRVATVSTPGPTWFGTETITFFATDTAGASDSDAATFNGIACGDANGDGIAGNISDVVYIIVYIFQGGPPPDPYSAGDVSCDGQVNIVDVVWLISYIFDNGPAPCECRQ